MGHPLEAEPDSLARRSPAKEDNQRHALEVPALVRRKNHDTRTDGIFEKHRALPVVAAEGLAQAAHSLLESAGRLLQGFGHSRIEC